MENKDGIFKRVFSSMGLSEEDDDELELEEVQEETPVDKKQRNMIKNDKVRQSDDFEEIEAVRSINRSGKIVSINGGVAPKVILKKPKEMEDMMEVVDAVKSRKIAVVNLLDVDLPLAQRMIDYVGGACYAINGKFAQISHLVYILVGENVDLTNYIKTEVKSQATETLNLSDD